MENMLNIKHLSILFLLIHHCVGPPAKTKESGDATKAEENNSPNIDDLGLEYNRYLKEVVNALESDPEFRKKLETADEADFRNGKVAAELEYVNHHVRTKLDELKRTELQRLRDLVKQAEEIEKNEVNPYHVNPGHVDHSNPHTFESADLHKLITQVRQDLAEADRKRREEFKEYELQKKFEEEQKIKAMDEEHKKQFLHELEEQKKKHQQHQPLHHPGSKAQLEEVWEKQDHMEHQKFNPRTFFLLHDINGDGYWDEDEVKALFIKELDKLYEAGAPEDDMREREEEMERMREHVFKEADTNGDRLISFEEFLEQTKKQEFNKDEGWETLDTQPQFTQQEYEEFERRRQQEIQRLIEQGHLQPYPPGMVPPGYQQHPGQFQQQYHYPDPNHVQQQYVQNAGYHPQAVPHPAQYQPQAGHQYPQQHYQLPQQHPNQIPQHPNQIPQQNLNHLPQQHPNQIPQQHLNQVPQQHLNQVPQQHPNQVPQQHPNQVPQQNPNQVPQQLSNQPNQAPPQAAQPVPPQQPNQASQNIPQPPGQVSQVPQSSNQIPQQQYQQVHQTQYQQGQPQQYGQQAYQQQGQPQQYQQQGQPQQYHDPNQIVPNVNQQVPGGNQGINSNSNQKEPSSQQIPSANQLPQVKVGQQPSQGTYGSISNQQPPQPPAYQQNHLDSDANKASVKDAPKSN